MSEINDWNAQIIEEFRANGGEVGGQFEGAPLLLLHTTGAKTGKERIAPMMYQAVDGGWAVFASKAGAPDNPDWYHNLVSAGRAEVERGTQRYAVTVTEVTGAERDAIFDRQVERVPGFGEYAARTAGVRVIPVLRLTRVAE